jgi:hypothetical protein
MNDVAVTRQLLDDLLHDKRDREVLIYTGGLVGLCSCQARQLLERCEGCWQKLVEAKHLQ